ncbi:hypothetical protein [Kaistia adipata]|uniref:glycine-rich domain-containing protein n=1 Tax=Kaistia adipata TaxID=166954 RepID=UPI000428834C|nr:hypothetical protein [Kaistia adipata]
MAIDNRTLNRGYRLPNVGNLMKSEDLPRLILSLEMIDEDMATVVADVLGKAPSDHEHTMAAIIGLADALAGKAAFVHNHSIGSLQGVDFSGAATNQFAKFNGSLWIPAFIQAADLANKIITNAKLRDSDALTVIGRAAASIGSPGDISALANDTFLRRVGDALGFGRLTAGMVPDNILTFAMLASSAIATKAEAEAGNAPDKLLTVERGAEQIAALGGGGVKTTVFGIGGTFVKDPKAKKILVRGVGAGGGGGGTANGASCRGAGGWGAYGGEALFDAADVPSSVSVTVGAGGPGGSSSGGNGGSGGTTSFGDLLVLPGGPAGSGATTSAQIPPRAAPPGPATISALALFGYAMLAVLPDYPDIDNSPLRGLGSLWGTGGAPRASQNNGIAGTGYGAGGSGAYANLRTGGAGSDGLLVVEERF